MVAVETGKAGGADDKLRLPIPILVNSGPDGRAYIFSHEDAFYVRRTLRLLGDFCGTLPKHTAQNQYLSLPLALSHDEASFGIARGFFVPVSDAPDDYVENGEEAAQAFFEARLFDVNRQVDEAVANQIAERERRTIKDRKRKREESDDGYTDTERKKPMKSQNSPTQPPKKIMRTSFFSRVSRGIRAAVHAIAPAFVAPPELLQEEEEVMNGSSAVVDDIGEAHEVEDVREQALLTRIRRQAQSTTLMVTATEARQDELCKTRRRRVKLQLPHGIAKERLQSRALVFADLYDKGYFMSCGAKFGADFLAYAGDPQLFHAALAIIVTKEDEEISPLEVVAIGRLGDSTKKRTLLAYFNGKKVVYVGIQWEETLP